MGVTTTGLFNKDVKKFVRGIKKMVDNGVIISKETLSDLEEAISKGSGFVRIECKNVGYRGTFHYFNVGKNIFESEYKEDLPKSVRKMKNASGCIAFSTGARQSGFDFLVELSKYMEDGCYIQAIDTNELSSSYLYYEKGKLSKDIVDKSKLPLPMLLGYYGVFKYQGNSFYRLSSNELDKVEGNIKGVVYETELLPNKKNTLVTEIGIVTDKAFYIVNGYENDLDLMQFYYTNNTDSVNALIKYRNTLRTSNNISEFLSKTKNKKKVKSLEDYFTI